MTWLRAWCLLVLLFLAGPILVVVIASFTAGGDRVPVLAVQAYQQSASLMNWPMGAAIGVLLLVATSTVLRLFLASLAHTSPSPLAGEGRGGGNVEAPAEPPTLRPPP